MDAFLHCGHEYKQQSSGGATRVGGDFYLKQYISPNDPIFAGHFPHLPIYPGVLLLDLMQRTVQRHAEQNLGLKVALSEVVRVSFQHPVFPGTTVAVTGTCDVQLASILRARVRLESQQVVATALLEFKVDDHAN